MKFNNKILGIIFILLLVILFLRKTMNKPDVRSFREVLVAIDTAVVDKIVLTNGMQNPIELQKQNGNWTASSNGKTVPATDNSVKELLVNMANIKLQQLVSRNREKWTDYELDDTTGKKVEVYNNGELLDAFYAGRFDFNQQSRSAKTYFRKAGEDDVYSVDGFLSMTFDKKLDDFRNKKLFNGIQKNQIKSISFESKSGNRKINFISNQWLNENNQPLDSMKVENYLAQLVNKSGTQIDDDFSVNMDNLEGTIQLANENNNSLVELKYYTEAAKNKPFIFHSSKNKGVYFRSDSSGLYQSLVKGFGELNR